jgi:hypothetical protein
MRRQMKILAFAVSMAAAGAALAQTNPLASNSRHPAIQPGGNGPLANTQLSSPLTAWKPLAPPGPLTPVPEPSEWAMLLIGLALVGFIVRRNVKRA